MSVLVVCEHDRGELATETLQALAFARSLGDDATEAVVIGEEADGLVATLAAHGATKAHLVKHPLLTDYAPEAWGESVAQLVSQLSPLAVVAAGTDRGNEVLAHVAAVADLPFCANATEVDASGDSWELTRVRWGGSLLERSRLTAPVKLLSVAPHAWQPTETGGGDIPTEVHKPELADELARTRVVDRVQLTEGITLATAPVVVSGGRGVGSAEGFTVLEELAELLGGAVGCSRVVTNNGWRSHADQVGQTGTRVAPDLYIACGISGAIQHWVGMMAAKKVLAINTDPEAPMVTKADYAVVGDLHEVLPAVVEEVKRRKA